jgi:hypothetical protein
VGQRQPGQGVHGDRQPAVRCHTPPDRGLCCNSFCYITTGVKRQNGCRLSLAATRGLLLDLLITGDRAILNDAADLFAELVTRPAGGSVG